MKNKSILDQIGIQQWRLREPINKPFEDPIATKAEAEAPLQETLSPTATELSQRLFDPSLVKATEVVSDPAASVTQIVDQNAQKAEQKVQEYDWPALIELLNDKQHCRSCSQVIPILGDGNITADWMFVFDSPTARDIEQQELLTGRVGQLFDAILSALQLERGAVYLSSIFKCPPAENISENAAQCDGLLQQQIKLVQPKVVITFGEFAAQALIKANEDLEQLRQQQQRQCYSQPIPVIPTYSLMQMLDMPLLKAKVWDDLKNAKLLTEN